ncbi:glycine zipper domain-containing protein [Lysobacter firmicutimachus]|uniref:Glycine zipper domain-containing protein n=1 Tax=Lysobacter firmicutimachus TaxID=1792846 RepID=A0AAU8MSA7_9GAMM
MANPNDPRASQSDRDLNRDPITGAPGSHPVGVGLGGASGAAAGAVVGALGGPIGALIGAGIGTVAGAAVGKDLAERVDPTGEAEYWREEHTHRPYYNQQYDYDSDYAPAYRYGGEARYRYGDRAWDATTETELERGWSNARDKSRLDWAMARPAVRDAWDRADRSYRVYDATDRYHAARFDQADYRDPQANYEDDYRPAYRYGTMARHQYGDRAWDDRLESDLGRGWDRVKGQSRLGWEKAKAAVRDAWHSVERALPGDADRDGR